MKIGIISDTHEEIDKVRKVIGILKERGCEELIHCGDLCAPFMIEEIAKFDGGVNCILGNVGDAWMTSERARKFGVNFQRDLLELEKGGKKIAVHHYPKIAEVLAKSGEYDIVFYGHNHLKDKKKVGDVWLVNPGEILGWKGNPSYAIYDTELNEVDIFDLE